MTCEKTFSIAVSAGSPCATMFSGLVWPAPTLFTDPTGGAAVASGTFLGNTFNASTSASTAGVDLSSASVNCNGTFDYTGPEIICCLDVDFTINDVNGGSSGFNIIIWHDGNFIALFTASVVPPYSFTIPESLIPTPVMVQVNVQSSSGSGSGAASASIIINSATIGSC